MDIVMPKGANLSKGKSKPSKQLKLPDDRVCSETQIANKDMAGDEASGGRHLEV